MTNHEKVSQVSDPRDGGYTLLEVLIAVALLAAIATLASNTLRYARQSYTRTQTELETAGPQVVQHFLYRLIEQAQPIHLPARRSDEATFVLGGSLRLQFMSNYTVAAQYAGIYETELVFEPTNGELGDIVLRQRPYRPRKDNSDGLDGVAEAIVLLRSVQSLRIQYLGAGRLGEPDIWQDTWTNSKFLPKLIQIDISFATGDSRIWPSLISRPKLAD